MNTDTDTPTDTLAELDASLAHRLQLQAAGPGRWRSQYGDVNQNGRAFGGQLLGQALRAALMGLPADRQATMMQFVFLQGALPTEPVLYEVRPLQDGKRFSTLQVRGAQGERQVAQALVSAALTLPGPSHALPSAAPAGERPEDLPAWTELPEPLHERLALMGGYGRDRNRAIDLRVPEAARQLGGQAPGANFRYWMKASQPIGEDPHRQAAALAYLSDWWLNCCILVPHLARAGERPVYISSLNHALWLHATPRADRWLHVHASSAHAGQGRGLATAQIHDEAGRHIATASQDCLVTYTD